MLRLEDLQPNSGARKNKKRVGRGNASNGTYSGRGMKGQRARAGFRMPPGFEGGQTPLWKRVPKRGFTNLFRKEYACINLDQLSEEFGAGDEITAEVLLEKGLISNLRDGLKILGRGEIEVALNIQAHKASKSAVAKIEAAGGSIQLLEPVEDGTKTSPAPAVAEEAETQADEEEAITETSGDDEDAGEDEAGE